MGRLLYGSDLLCCVLFLPEHRKNHLAGKRFVTDSDVEQVPTSCLQTVATIFFEAGIQALVWWLDRCLNVNGWYMEVWCVPSATYVSCLNQVSKILGIRVLVALNFGTLLLLMCAEPSTMHCINQHVVCLLWDSAPSHVAAIVKQCFANTNVAVLHHPSYSLNLAHTEFSLSRTQIFPETSAFPVHNGD
jgi:hypothetical protein